MKKLILTITMVAALFCQGCGMTGVYVVGGLIGAAIVLAPRDERGSFVDVESKKVAEEKAEKEALRNQIDSECVVANE